MPESQGIPEIYADSAQIAVASEGIFLGFRALVPFSLSENEPGEPESTTEMKSIVRLSHTNAKILAILLKRALKSYERDVEDIALPAGFAEVAKLTADEW